MRFVLGLIFLLLAPALFGAQQPLRAATTKTIPVVFSSTIFSADAAPSDSARHAQALHKKIVAAVLAFPPFGCLGLHRIYLHSQPWVPFVYLVTFGGCFGILPLIDFAVILIKKPEEIKVFENNSKIFMWEK